MLSMSSAPPASMICWVTKRCKGDNEGWTTTGDEIRADSDEEGETEREKEAPTAAGGVVRPLKEAAACRWG